MSTLADTASASADVALETPIGTVVLRGDDDALTRLLLPGYAGDATIAAAVRYPNAESLHARPGRAPLAAARELDEYFAGSRTAFDVPLALTGTRFQLDVWRALAEIPFGETISYGELAREVGRPRAFRAVGQANGANPIAIILPCHRVLAGGGAIGGYGGGLEAKRTLLALEGVTV